MSDQDWVKELLQIYDEDTKLSDKQIRIIEAAVEIFSEKGYSGASTNEIAKKAGVAEGTIFRHWKTKKDLLLSIVTPTITQTVAPFLAKGFVKEVFAGQYDSYEDFVRVLFNNRFALVKKHFPILKVFIQEIAFHSELKEQYQKIFTKHVLEKFTEIIEHFQEKGELIDLPPITIIRMTITSIAGLLFTRFLVIPENDWDDELEIEQTIQFMMHGLRKKI